MEKVLRQINLARGWPSLENLRRVAPLVQKWSAASLQAACESDEAAGSLFGYCSTCPVVQRDFEISLKDFMSRNGYGSRDKVDRLSITLTPGGSYAIDVCTRQAIVDLGKRDVALVESPTYYLADRIFGEHNLEVVGVDSDECGLVPESLEDMLIRLKNEGKTVQILYTIPGHHNPTSCTLSDERRKRIVELSQKYDFYIIADEVYQSLSFQDHEFPPSLATLDKRVFSVSSFSKIISPGMRLGWISTEAQVTVGKGVFESGGNISSYTAAMIHPGLESREIDKHLSIIRSDLYLRAKTLYTALQQALGRLNLPDVLISY
uniref:Aminotransferase class I/classII large domain-containing protein n=1 Tax=Aplanochytrium stocchinoi TaxID=215587 RepID=A0A7S3PCY6_9STRA|mmetsp:Transcript_7423/g.8440  ORF Transcript_7423/g.8440 Transcript_7423/m.8440 type:complete len:320 (+) Transcript_7423:24-983(+)